jgi:thiamine-phosphate pyrophosphorylase
MTQVIDRPPRLMVITESARYGDAVTLERLEGLLQGARPSSVVVQLRDLERGVRERLALGRHLSRLTQATGQFLAVNDRLDLAMLLGAPWVHLPERGVSVGEARSLLGAGVRVSRACHEVAAPAVAPDALVLSPVVQARKGNAALGVGALARLRARVGPRIWLYALGGVSADAVPDCLDAGADGVAVMGAAFDGRPFAPLLDALGIRRPPDA